MILGCCLAPNFTCRVGGVGVSSALGGSSGGGVDALRSGNRLDDRLGCVKLVGGVGVDSKAFAR
jgi:hypothetical protein